MAKDVLSVAAVVFFLSAKPLVPPLLPTLLALLSSFVYLPPKPLAEPLATILQDDQ
jgi:hypothetical protein